MKKYFLIPVSILILHAAGMAQDFTVVVKAHHFSPSDRVFRAIYGGGWTYGAEATIRPWKNIGFWLGGHLYTKKGELSFTREETKLEIFPIGGGLKYMTTSGRTDFYAGLGVGYFHFNETNPIGNVDKAHVGALAKIGTLIRLREAIVLDIFLDYTYCRLKPADTAINIGGFLTGAGLGIEF